LVRDDFYEQRLSEIKIPARLNPCRRAWKARTDRRNEALDCSVYAVYLRRHLRRPQQWDLDEMRLRQGSLIAALTEADAGVEKAFTPDTESEKAQDPPAIPPPPEAMQTPAPARPTASPRHLLSAEQRPLDVHARQSISQELGHGRPQIVGVYCGK
jgi:phage terminase large subunit GpA-like protein